MLNNANEERYRRLKLGIALDTLSMAELDLMERQLTREWTTDSLRSIFWRLSWDDLRLLTDFLGTRKGRDVVVRSIRMVLRMKERDTGVPRWKED